MGNSVYLTHADLEQTIRTIKIVVAVIAIIEGIIISIACAKLADDKGRSAGGWFVLGLFFGVIALLILVFISNVDVQQSSYSYLTAKREIDGRRKNSNNWFCQCGACNPTSCNVCTICGRTRTDSNPSALNMNKYYGNSNNNSQLIKWKCSSCGYENNPKATMCINCEKEKE